MRSAKYDLKTGPQRSYKNKGLFKSPFYIFGLDRKHLSNLLLDLMRSLKRRYICILSAITCNKTRGRRSYKKMRVISKVSITGNALFFC